MLYFHFFFPHIIRNNGELQEGIEAAFASLMVCGGMDRVINGELSLGIENLACVRCNDGFDLHEQIVNSSGQVWHADCFV